MTTPGFDAIVPQSQQHVEAAWRERAHRLSQRPDFAGAAAKHFPGVVLGIGKERYGIDLPDVAEVLPPVAPTPVPGAPAVFAGVINVHGEIRPVIDLRRLRMRRYAGRSQSDPDGPSGASDSAAQGRARGGAPDR